MERRVVQITITKMDITKRGPSNSDNDANIFRFTLNHPIEGVPGLETVKSVAAGECIPKDWGDLGRAMVFKTAIRGKSPLTVEAIAVDRKSKAAKFIRKVLRGVIGGFAGVWSKEFGDDYAGVATKTAGSSLADLVDSTDSVTPLGKGVVVIDSEAFARGKADVTGEAAGGQARPSIGTSVEPVETREAESNHGAQPKTATYAAENAWLAERVELLVPKDVKYRDGKNVVELEKGETNGSVELKIESIGN